MHVMNSYHFIHGFTKLPITLKVINGWQIHHLLFIYSPPFIVVRIYHYAILMNSISYSFGNKESLIITSICLYTSHSRPIATVTANFPMQNNKSVKAAFTSDVRKIQYSGWGLISNAVLSFAPCCIFYWPTPYNVASIHTSPETVL